MKERIQMRGHCQGCGRLQAATNGKLAHHGYTLEHGYFHGTCYGAKQLPLEVSRELLDKNVVGARKHADDMDDRALKLAQREINPKGMKKGFGKSERFVPYAELDEVDRRRARERAIVACENDTRITRRWAEDMLKLADQIHGRPLIEVKVNDQSKVINVGDKVKVHGKEVEVVKIAYATARGVGPGLNGQSVEHVYWAGADGALRSYPKRYARKVVANG